MSQHTPGPWRDVLPTDNSAWIKTKTGQYLAEIVYDEMNPQSFEERNANARLIAQAPTMYEYLKRIDQAGLGSVTRTEARNILHKIEGTK